MLQKGLALNPGGEDHMPRVLYIEDDGDMIDLVKVILSTQGIEVHGITEIGDLIGDVAEVSPDLILLDIMMPKMNGFGVYKLLKSEEKTSEIPIIVISAMKSAVDRINSDDAIEVEACILKPFKLGDLVDIITSALPETP